MFNIGDLVKCYFGGKWEIGEITGKHGTADYYAITLDNGYAIYRWAEDLEKAF